jgi:apolipoprotein N-acyltransferase
MAARYRFALALLLGALSATGFAPLHLWPNTLFCLAGLIALIDRAGNRSTAFMTGWGFGLGNFTVGLNWIAHAFVYQDAMPHWYGYLAVVLLSLYLAVFPATATLLAWGFAWADRSERRNPIALTLAFAGSWAFTEYLRATLFTGFAWNPIGVIWLDTGVEHIARLIGTYGLGMVSILTGGVLWMALRKQLRRALPLAVTLVAVVALAWAHSHWTRPAPRTAGVAIRVIQPNIDQGEKYSPAAEARSFAKLERLTGQPSATPRLVFWPEAAVFAILDMEPEWRARIAALLGPGDLLMTGGDKYYFKKSKKSFYEAQDLAGANNSLWVLMPDGRIAGRYDKAHLVPYGEYLPMRPLLSAIGLSRLVPGDVDFWPGPGPRTLDLAAAQGHPALKMGVQICYEIIFSGEVIDRNHRPDFLFNPSNDAWFGNWGPPQHLAQARLRAVEEAMPVIRATPTGISAVVDSSGTIIATIPQHREAFIDTKLPPAAPPTLFAHFGNTLPMLIAALLMLSGVAIRRGNR